MLDSFKRILQFIRKGACEQIHPHFVPSSPILFLSQSLFWQLKVTSAITQQLLKLPHLRHTLKVFLFHQKVMFCCRDIQVFLFLAIP